MKNKSENHYIDGILTMLVFGIFAACIVLALLSGAGVYKRLTAANLSSYNQRTCLQYLSTKLRTAESPDSVHIASLGGVDALAISETINGDGFTTYIYSYDGWLMELYCLDGINAGPDAGEKLMESGPVDFAIENSLVTISLEASASGSPQELMLSIRGRKDDAA